MNELLDLLKKIKPGVDYEKETALIDNQIFASLDIIRLVAMISDEFDVEVKVTDLIPENFNSAKAMMAMI